MKERTFSPGKGCVYGKRRKQSISVTADRLALL